MKKHVFSSAVLIIAMLIMSFFCVQVCAEGDNIIGDGGHIDTGGLFPGLDTGCSITVVHETVDGNVLETWVEKGNAGEEYTFFARAYNGYSVVQIPDNASGVFSSAGDTVTFVYERVFYDYEILADGIKIDEVYSSCVLFAASYRDEILVDAGFTDIDEGNSNTQITFDELGLDLGDADTVKAFILSDTETLRPLAVHRVYEISEKRDAYEFAWSNGNYANVLAQRSNSIRENLKSGWVYDNRGANPIISVERPVSTIQDVSDTEGTAFIREFNRIDSDVIKADYIFKAKGDGVYTEFRDEDGNSAYQVKLVDGMWCVLTPSGDYEEISESNSGSMDPDKFRVLLDFKNGKSKTYINGVYCGEHDLLSDNTVNFRFATDEESNGSYSPMQIEFTANHVLYESFDNFGLDSVYGWETMGNVSVKNCELVLGGKASVKNNFSRSIQSKFAAETYVYRSASENMALTLSSGNTTVFELEAKKGKLLANGMPVYDLTDDMWYRFRIVCDPASAKATVYLNGRVITEQRLYTTEAVDSYTISSESGKTVYDNIQIFELCEHDDYVPAPEKKASLDDYIVFINVCSLWNNDVHTGWACITPYDNSKPVLGYYDEGNPETADWEINYLVNHGVDVQVFCWYNRSAKGALKESGNAAQLHDGYMYSKYGDYMKYVIMLETAATAFNSEQFRNYIVPYWFENYFLDDRYLKIDNKIVLHSWYAGRLSQSNYFGSVEGAQAEMDYLNEVAKSYGFDGMILTCADGSGSTAYQFGFEAKGAYHWDAYDEVTGEGNSGNTYDLNVSNNLAEAKAGQSKGFYHIPTISVGFDCVPWYARPRDPLMSVSDFQKSHDWVKNTYIPTYGTTGTWKDRAVWLSTWNEYGEGTYMIPSGLNGFGYMDVIRNAYTDLSSSHTDVVPTEAQLERITHKYPQYTRKLWRAEYETYDEPSLDYDFGGEFEYEEPVNTVTFRDRTFVESLSGISKYSGATLVFNSDKSVSGTTTNSDPQVYVYDAKNIDVTDIDALRITMQIPEGAKAEVFFSTTADKTLNQTKSLSVTATTGDLCEYIFPFASNSAWTGTLNLLRIDPVSSGTGVEFYIKNVEFIKKSPVKLFINGIDSTSKVPYELFGDRVLFPFDPETSMHYNLFVFHTWNKDNGVLKIEGEGHEIVYTVGKSTFKVDGVTEDLGYTVNTVDGLPLIDIEQLALILDYEVRREGSRIVIVTPEYDMYENMVEGMMLAQQGRWEFDSNDTLGFSVNNGMISLEDGYIHVESNGASLDIQLANAEKYELDTTKFNQLEIRARHDYSSYSSSANGFSLYYLTDKDSSWNEAKSIKGTIRTPSSNGEWITYVLSLPEAVKGEDAWKDTIRSVRFDPFDSIGYMDIDYIRFTYNPNLLTADENNEFENGNAEDETNVEFYSTNGTVTIEADTECDENNVYRVVPSSYSNGYLHFLKEFTFEENTEYKVTFMARAIPDANGVITDMRIGCNMDIDSGIGCGAIVLGTEGEWQTFEGTFTTGTITSPDSTRFRLYGEPVIKGTKLSAYELDNIAISKVVAEETVSE